MYRPATRHFCISCQGVSFLLAAVGHLLIFTLKPIDMAITKGQQAPDFTLWSTDKEKVSLNDKKGKNVVLLFFPMAFTGVCTAELCGVRDNYQMYNDLNAEVFGISVDSVPVLKKFKEDQNYNFSLLSDFNKEAMTAYDSKYETFANDMRGVAKRSAFVIDKEGTVQYAEVLENAGEQPDFKAIEATLRSLN